MRAAQLGESALTPLRSGAWLKGWNWFCWLPLVWFVLLIPSSTTFYREGAWLQAANLALLLGEVTAVPLLGLLTARFGRLKGGRHLDAFLTLYPRSFLTGAIPAFALFLLSGYFMAWIIRSGVLAPTPEFGEWLASGRAHGQIGLLGLVVLWVVRVVSLTRFFRRFAAPEGNSDLREGSVASSWIALSLLSVLYLSVLLVGKERGGEEGTSVILGVFFLLLEGLAPTALVRRSPEGAECALGAARWLRLWGTTTGLAFLGGLALMALGTFAGWMGSWRLAPAPIARLVSEHYDFDWRILASIVIFWLLRVAICAGLERSTRNS